MPILRRTRYPVALATVAILVMPMSVSASLMFEGGGTPARRASATCPLTGKKTRRSVAKHPAVAVKVDNSEEARPQPGLRNADVVIESLVEGGTTRLTAVYHCGSSDTVGPVRSGRFDDPQTMQAFTDFLATSGNNALVAANFEESGVVAVDEVSGGAAMQREEDLDAPYNLFADTEALRALASESLVEGPDRMTFGSMPPGSKKTTVVELEFSDATAVGYRWTRKGWARSQDGSAFTSGGNRVYAQNVLVQVVDVTSSTTLVDVNGVASPLMSLEGEGKAYLFRDGNVLPGKWSDDGAGGPVFKTNKGKPYTFAIGKTWYEFVPSAAGELTGKVAYH